MSPDPILATDAAALNQSRAVRAGQGASRLLVARARAGEARDGLIRSSREQAPVLAHNQKNIDRYAMPIGLDLKAGGLRGSIKSRGAIIPITTQAPPAAGSRESTSEWSGQTLAGASRPPPPEREGVMRYDKSSYHRGMFLTSYPVITKSETCQRHSRSGQPRASQKSKSS